MNTYNMFIYWACEWWVRNCVLQASSWCLTRLLAPGWKAPRHRWQRVCTPQPETLKQKHVMIAKKCPFRVQCHVETYWHLASRQEYPLVECHVPAAADQGTPALLRWTWTPPLVSACPPWMLCGGVRRVFYSVGVLMNHPSGLHSQTMVHCCAQAASLVQISTQQ